MSELERLPSGLIAEVISINDGSPRVSVEILEASLRSTALEISLHWQIIFKLTRS